MHPQSFHLISNISGKLSWSGFSLQVDDN